MPLYPDQRFDSAAGVELAAEAALLEARLLVLREALAGVDARISAIAEELHRLDR